jgi:hypothetical protein
MTYSIWGEYLYLQPNGSDLYYAAEALGLDPDIAVPAVSPNWVILEIDPSYHSAFQVGWGALWGASQISLALDWERLRASDSDSFTASAAGAMVGPLADIGPNSALYTSARGHYRSAFDAVNFNFGKDVCIGEHFHLNGHLGAEFLRIRQVTHQHYSNPTIQISRDFSNGSTFIGAGPELGLDYEYRLCAGLFLQGNSLFSLVMGQMSNQVSYASTTPELNALQCPNPNNQSTSVPHRTQLVPGLEQRVGFSYLIDFKSVKLTFALGYQCQIYINAIQTMDMTAPQVLPSLDVITVDDGLYAVGFERTLSNYMLTGPYASADIRF